MPELEPAAPLRKADTDRLKTLNLVKSWLERQFRHRIGYSMD
jgi:hypothetical protein